MVRVSLTAAVLLLLNGVDAVAHKLVRYGAPGLEQPGLIDSRGQLRTLSEHFEDFDPATLGSLHIVASGFNYSDHAEETNTPIPEEPLLFSKSATALSGPFDAIVTPRDSQALDYEAELVIVIGTRASYVAEADALNYVAGFATGNDVSERSFQMDRGGQFVKGKSADTFAPVGPYLVTTDAVADVQALSINTWVNGERRQQSNTRHMIFSAAHLVSYISRFMTLEPGDLIFTGTPSGVGVAMSPPKFLKPGDIVEIEIDGLGRQRQTIAPPR
jgi:2-keto-4-pentenoate hydratase/2-oxohepta-3-ene-1,7-dioic acid hydratase in catechol pathway